MVPAQPRHIAPRAADQAPLGTGPGQGGKARRGPGERSPGLPACPAGRTQPERQQRLPGLGWATWPDPPQRHPPPFRGSEIFLAFPRRSGPCLRHGGTQATGGALLPPLCFSASSPSFPFCISANVGNQTWLVDFFPMSAPQLW